MKTIKFIAIVALSAAVAFGAGWAVLAMGGSENAFFCTYFFGAMFVALLLGAFDMREKKSGKTIHDTIKHYNGRKSYGQAAVFIGTACLFVGTPQECEEVADDLWHYAQNAEVRTLDGTESLEIL